MSVIVTFFAAPDDASAAAALVAGPEPACDSVDFGSFDPEEAVVQWECLLAGGSAEALADAGEPRTVAEEDDGGCLVLALSPRLSAALAAAGPAALRDAAVAWSRLLAEDGRAVGEDVAGEILSEVAALAARSGEGGSSVYCWIA
ncbi:hypothetical protein ACFV1L_00550 [Kitasatospora sp. NPDC059646]|uniref:hypothetical protein n=1 Tax=Kitasatospora sp. NPDC059646 TaxID=3346893 RepID=UPI0036A062DB